MTLYDSVKTYQVSCLTAAGASVYCGKDSEVGRVSLEARQEKSLLVQEGQEWNPDRGELRDSRGKISDAIR